MGVREKGGRRGGRTATTAAAAELKGPAHAPHVPATVRDAEAVAAHLEVLDAVLDAAIEDAGAQERDAGQRVRGPGVAVAAVGLGVYEGGEPGVEGLHHCGGMLDNVVGGR